MVHVILKERKKIHAHTQAQNHIHTHTIKLRDRGEQCRKE